MTLASLRDRFAVPVVWIARQVAARPYVALAVWIVSLVVVAWVL
jgi:hypothetical protein